MAKLSKRKKSRKPRHTRRGIFFAALLTGLLAVAGMGVGIARGDLPVQLSISGQNFYATVAKLEGSDVAVYPRTVETVSHGRVETVVVTMGDATLTDLCLAMQGPNLPVVGTVTMIIRAAGPSTKATNMMMDVDGLDADLTLDNVVVGSAQAARDVASSELATAIAAPRASIVNVDTDVKALRAGSLSVSNTKVSIVRGAEKC